MGLFLQDRSQPILFQKEWVDFFESGDKLPQKDDVRYEADWNGLSLWNGHFFELQPS